MWSVLQCVAVCCSVFSILILHVYNPMFVPVCDVCCSALQCVAVCSMSRCFCLRLWSVCVSYGKSHVVRECECMCVCARMCACVHGCVCVGACVGVCVGVRVHACARAFVCASMHLYLWLCIVFVCKAVLFGKQQVWFRLIFGRVYSIPFHVYFVLICVCLYVYMYIHM